MFKYIILILTSTIYQTCSSYGNEIRENIVDVSVVYNYLKFSQDSDLFSSTKVIGDFQQYQSGLKNEDVYLNISQLIRKYGHNMEEHEITTKDGYILNLMRIPRKGPAVFLMHGLLMSADDWVTAGPESGIAYLLANEGYDVWLGNARGNKHSRRHETITPSSPEFWDFSWDEIGRYDLPAMIDHVLTVTNQTQVLYVSHSQGGTAVIVMCSELPEYNDKISLMITMAVPAALPNIKSPFLNFLKFITFYHPELLFSLAKEIGLYEFLPSSNLMKTFGNNVCGSGELAELVCTNIVFLICGFNADQLNVTNLPVLFSHFPAGAATKQIEHFSQTFISGEFRRFDYGGARNLELYGSTEPPKYSVEKITAPIAIFYSDNDWLVSAEDVEALRVRLKNVVDYYRVPLQKFNHVDYLFGKDSKELIFTKMLSLLKKY